MATGCNSAAGGGEADSIEVGAWVWCLPYWNSESKSSPFLLLKGQLYDSESFESERILGCHNFLVLTRNIVEKTNIFI